MIDLSGSGTTASIMVPEMPSLNGKRVLVTGAARRIGRSIALRLAAEGADVLIHYNTSEAEARLTAEHCGSTGLVRANLESVSEIRAMFETAGPLDALVNNAARFTRFDPLDITEKDWDHIHAVNLKAAFFCAQSAARAMLGSGRGGRIVNISSMGGIKAWPDHAHYCASKAGLIHLTKALAQAWAPEISVNSVAPGVIPFEEAGEAEIQRFIDRTPAKRAGTGDEIAEAVLNFLTCSKFVTGQVMAVDGGLSLR
jgi:NAD(P)-dependent dehydrogenase (short-subunit alcohol dehydrogenase family)